jgi:hypothetical protein
MRSKTADNWRDAYVLIQRGQKLLLVIPEGMIHPDGTRQTQLSLIANAEPGACHRSLDGRTTKLESTTMADPDRMLSLLHRGSHLVLLTLGTPAQNR